MNRKCVEKQRSKREELELLRKKDRASVEEILRLHGVIRREREQAALAVEQVRQMCERLMGAAIRASGQEEIVIFPGAFDGEIACYMREDGSMAFRVEAACDGH